MNYRRSSLAIGRRTRTDVLKDKDIRKDKDGCDVFEDYWTDSEDDRSSYSSVSTKSVKDINEKEQNISDSGKGDSGSKLEEAKKSSTCRVVESEQNISTSTAAEIPTIKSLKKSQMRKSFINILSVSKSSQNKNCTLSHDVTKTVTEIQGEMLNYTENQSDNSIRDKTALDNHASPRNSTMISKQPDELNFADASTIDQSKECAVASNSRTVNITHRISKSPKRISKKHIFDLIDNKSFKDSEFRVLKSVSPLSKSVNKTVTLSDKNMKSTFPKSYQNLDDPPGNFGKLNKISEAKISAISQNSVFSKSANSLKPVGKHNVKTRSAVEIKKILSTYDDYDAHIMQIIKENSENGLESSETQNNTRILRKQNKDNSTFNSYENIEKESNLETDLSEDVSIAYNEQSDNNINIFENVLGNTVLISEPKIDHKSKERENLKSTLEEEPKQITENNLEDISRSSKNTTPKYDLITKNRKIKKASKKNIPQSVKDGSTVDNMQKKCSSDERDQHDSLAVNTVLISKPKIDHKSKEREKCISTLEEESKQIAENNLEDDVTRSSENTTPKYDPITKNRKIKKVSKNKNIPQSAKDGSTVENMQKKYSSDEKDQHDTSAVNTVIISKPKIDHKRNKREKCISTLEEESRQIAEINLEDVTQSSKNTAPKYDSITKNRKIKKVSKNKNIPQSVKDGSTVENMQKKYISDEKDQHDSSAVNTVIISKPKIDHKSKEKEKCISTLEEESKQIAENNLEDVTQSSKNTTPKYDPITKNRKMRKVSKNKNIPQSVKDRSTIENMQKKYSCDEKDQHGPLAVIDSECSVSARKGINTSYFDKNKSLNSLERSKRTEENSEDSDVENLSLSKNSNKRLKVKKNRSNGMLLESTAANKSETNVDINADEDVSDMEIDIGHQSEHSNKKKNPEKDFSFHDAFDLLVSKKKEKPKKKHSSTKSKNFTQMRKSNRTRYAPLAHWRNERLRYRFDKETVMILGVDEGTREDNFQIQSLMRRMNRDKVKEKKKRVNKASVYDSVNNKTVKLNLVKTFPSVPWDLPPNASGSSAYRIKRTLETSTCAFGFLEINAQSSKPSQYMPEEDLQMMVIKGKLEIAVQENNFIVSEKDMFVVPRNTAYSLKNIGSTKALLSYSVGKFKFLEKQHLK